MHYLNITQLVFCFNRLFLLKTQNFQDDALLVQEIHSLILASIRHRLFLLAPTLSLNYPDIVTFHLVSGDLWGGE